MYRQMNYNTLVSYSFAGRTIFLFAWRPLLSAHSSLRQPYLAFRPCVLAFLGSHVSRYSSAFLDASSWSCKRWRRCSLFERFKSYQNCPTGTTSLSPSSSWSHRASVKRGKRGKSRYLNPKLATNRFPPVVASETMWAPRVVERYWIASEVETATSARACSAPCHVGPRKTPS